MQGTCRVITFCIFTTIIPSMLIILPLYLRNVKYADVMYKVSDSDVIQIHQGQSSIFCERHSLQMNTSFNAFQMKGWPEVSSKRRHIHLKKSMTLPDDTLEYWGFYLLKGAVVELKACSRYEGSKILVVKGDRVLNTCEILNDGKNMVQKNLLDEGHVRVTLEEPSRHRTNQSRDNQKDENNAGENIIDYPDDLVREKLQIPAKLGINLKTNTSDNNTSPIDKPEIGKEHIFSKYKRDIQSYHKPNTVLDTGINHGGNAFNGTMNYKEDSAVSSFENSLYQCYTGNILINEFFPYSPQCKSTEYLEKTTTLKVIHNVTLHGYYYYIFYSDNDFVQNDIHAIFDIYKPTFQYANLAESKMCINSTECEFNVGFLSGESVIVEVPTKDGIEFDEDDSSILISVCHPRMSIYVIFPVTVLLLIILFSFL